MARVDSTRAITIPLDEEACVLALGPYREGLSLRPESRAAIERAPKSPIGIPVRDVSCTLADAADMLDYFRSAADVLTTLGKDGAPACARAFDNVRHALRVAGVKV